MKPTAWAVIANLQALMKSNHPLIFLALAAMGPARAATSNPSTDEQVKHLAQRYNQVETQLDRSIRYIKKEGAGPETTIQQAWFNGAGDLIKVAVEHSDAAGSELTEYFARAFDYADDGMFVLTRKETPLGDGGTQVDESRKYYGEGKRGGYGELIRELRKSARFKPGESLDTVHTPNVVVDLAKQPKDDRSDDERLKAQSEFFSKPEKIATALQNVGPPDFDPFVKGDSEKFRVINGTASPDGRYAIALGFARDKINWDDFVDKDSAENGRTYRAENEEDVRNYVVDLTAQTILGETGCNYFGTRRRYNHRECTVTWSPDSTIFVQLWSEKWTYETCRAGKIAPGAKLSGVVDLGKETDKHAFAFLRKRRDSGEELAMNIDQLSNDGVIQIGVWKEVSSGERKGTTDFALSERMRLRATPAGLRAELLAIRKMPNEH
jgi:hypothetical protein